MTDAVADELAASKHRRPWVWYALSVGGLLLAAAFGASAWSDRQATAREAVAVHALKDLGVIVVMDGDGRHAASVNLSTLQSAESLAQALEHLPRLSFVTALDASRTEIRDEQLDFIGSLSNLKSLSLNETAIGDGGLARLKSLDNVQSLMLASTQITDRGLVALGGLGALSILDVSSTKVAADLSPLAELPQLEWLVLRNLTLDRTAFTHLKECTALRRVTLEGATFPAEALAALQQALPEISVNR